MARFALRLPSPHLSSCTYATAQNVATYGMTAIFPYFDIQRFAPNPHAIGVYSRPNPTGRTEGYFCTRCGSRLVHVSVGVSKGEEKVAKMLSVKAGCLEGLDKETMRKAIHIWTRSAVIDVPEGVEQYDEEPPGGSFAEE